MDKKSLKAFKVQLKDFEKRLLQKEKEHEEELGQKARPDDDLGKAREIFENIMRQISGENFRKDWHEKKETLWQKMTSLFILISE